MESSSRKAQQALGQHRSAAARSNLSQPALLLLVVSVALVGPASAFPSLFGRPPFAFRRQQAQQAAAAGVNQPQQQAQVEGGAAQQQQQQQQQAAAAAAAAAMAAEMLRLGAHQHAAFAPGPAHLQAAGGRPQQALVAQHTYSSGFVARPARQGHPQPAVLHQLAGPIFDEPEMVDEPRVRTGSGRSNLLGGGGGGEMHSSRPQQQMRLEPTHTSEIVDKLEQHIGGQIEQSLKQAARHYHSKERTAAASHEHEASPAQSSAEESSASGESGGGAEEQQQHQPEVEEVGPEKRHEQEHSEGEPHSAEHRSHEHQPPEAFEVHHKKGGKSFQYFHLGGGGGGGH